jgi:mycofactocin precursor
MTGPETTSPQQTEDLEQDALVAHAAVEELPIDGMCGVY